jgi:plastocyanin
MHHRRLLLPILTVVLLIGAAVPATAADTSVDVTANFTFAPKDIKINPGDTVTWNWSNDGHTTTSGRGQAESWNSGLRGEGAKFSHRFTHPGKYQYICVPHASIGMKGTVTVGTDTVRTTVGKVSAKPSGTSVTISLKLNEPAVVTLKLKGASKKTVKRGRLTAGQRSFKVKRLKPGSYKGTLTLSDDFDNKTTKKVSFRIR